MHRRDAAAHFVGRAELDDRRAHEHADHVGGAHHGQGGDREHEVRRQAEDQRRNAEHQHAGEKRPARVQLLLRGNVREEHACGDGADGEAAAHDPQAVGTDIENVARVDRQQRGDAAEEDREEVERNRAQEDALAPQIAHPFDHARERRAGARPGDTAAHADRDHRCGYAQRHRQAGGEGRLRAEEIEQAAGGGAEHGRGLAHRGAPRHRRRELLAHDEEGNEGLHRRA